MIQQTITEAFNSIKIEKGILSNEVITNELLRLQGQYMNMLSDYISIPYSQKLYEDLELDFDNRIKEKKELISTLSKSERQHIEQVIEGYKNEKWRAKEKMEDLKRKEENFLKRQGFFEENIRLRQSMLSK